MMRRARVRRALTACAFVPLAAWAADEDQIPNQTPAQSQSQTPTQTPNLLESQNPNSALGQLPLSLNDSQNQLPPNRTFIFATGGIGQTDNVELTPTGQQAQTMAEVGVAVDASRQGPVLNGTLKGELDYLYFIEHAYPGQFVGRVDGDGSWTIVPDRVKWVVQDSFGNAQVDALTAPNRDNIESVNVFSTGPDVLLEPTETMFLRLAGRYQASTWQTSPFNSQRAVGMASIGHDLSIVSSASLNADFASIRFQDPTVVNPNYDRRKFYLRYDTRGVRTSVAIDLGVAQVNDTGPYRSKLLAQLLLTRDLTPFQSLFLSAGQQYTDTADAFSGLTGGAAGYTILAPAAGSGGNYLDQSASAGWEYKRGRTTLGLTGRWDRNTYTIQATPQQIEEYFTENLPAPLNVERATAEARVQRDLTPVIAAEVHAMYIHEDYTTLGYVDHSIFAGAGVTYTANSKLQYRLKYDHQTRTVDVFPVESLRIAPGYSQNIIFLTFAYRLTE
jgi:hypothetical protein